jgi:hypothetical protein
MVRSLLDDLKAHYRVTHQNIDDALTKLSELDYSYNHRDSVKMKITLTDYVKSEFCEPLLYQFEKMAEQKHASIIKGSDNTIFIYNDELSYCLHWINQQGLYKRLIDYWLIQHDNFNQRQAHHLKEGEEFTDDEKKNLIHWLSEIVRLVKCGEDSVIIDDVENTDLFNAMIEAIEFPIVKLEKNSYKVYGWADED